LVRAEIQARVERAVGPNTAVLIGHSLGSVVAYEAACAHPAWDLALVTLGCPLGIRNLVFDRLHPSPEHRRGQFPAGAATWTNIADSGDVVALVKRLAPLFAGQVQDLLVDNGSKAHDISAYLTAAETGRAVTEGLARRVG
jgi:pimeloyl-ACP methyl ester carboxylesterase